ncbi:MAG TPA: hypothetical protein VME20_09725 [Acidimicrobiales bacterium]|nr:hypothetical protein [Acidimicrobiales bacterium]
MNSATNAVEGYLGETLCTPKPIPPPDPPSPAAVWGAVPLPEPDIQTNPATYGVTQLQSWFWLGNDSQGANDIISVGIDGYAVTVTAHPVAYYWIFGDGTGAVSDTEGSAGGAANASATHTYTQAGTYPLGVIVAWQGTYMFTGFGVTETVPLGPVDQPEHVVNYTVQQIRSALLP